MLSGECAMGKYPVECVKTMVKIAGRVEPEIDYWKRFKTMIILIYQILKQKLHIQHV